MKKFLSVAVAIVLGFSLCTFAYAEDVNYTEIETTPAETAVVDETMPVDETAVADETTPPDETAADETTPEDATQPDDEVILYSNEEIYQNGIAEEAKDVLYKGTDIPQTGSQAGELAVFAMLSAAVTAAFLYTKKKA